METTHITGHPWDAVIGGLLALVFCAAMLWNAISARKERKKRESMLNLMRALFEKAHVAKTQTIPSGPIIRANQSFCRMLGYTEAEVRAMCWKDITHPDDKAEAAGAVNAMLESKDGAPATFFVRYRAKDGSWVPAFVSVTLVESPACDGILLAEIQRTDEFVKKHKETQKRRDVSFVTEPIEA